MRMNKIVVGIIGGSGLDDPHIISHSKEIAIRTPYGKPSSNIISGEIAGKKVVIVSRHGRQHSIPPHLVPYRANIWALKLMKCSHILATTACGSLQEKMKPGDLVLIDQFIDFTKQRKSTFFEKKVIHTPMSVPLDQSLRTLVSKIAQKNGFRHHIGGTMITIEGPRFSTKAESVMFRKLGADCINMSTATEIVLSNEIRIPYQAIAMVTDYDCWKKNERPVSFNLILKRMEENSEKIKRVIIDTVDAL